MRSTRIAVYGARCVKHYCRKFDEVSCMEAVVSNSIRIARQLRRWYVLDRKRSPVSNSIVGSQNEALSPVGYGPRAAMQVVRDACP
jgi:hypothetical protein